MTHAGTGLDRPTRILLWMAAAWGVLLIVAALTVPAYQGEGATGTTSVTSVLGGPAAQPLTPTIAPPESRVNSSTTLVGVNGDHSLLIVSLPLAATGIVALGLSLRRRSGRVGAGQVASVATVVVSGAALLSMLTIGPFLIPVAALTIAACVRA